MIPKYANQDKEWTGKNHYSMDMIPELDFQIQEMEAAIHGIEMLKLEQRWKKHMKKMGECCGRCIEGMDECVLLKK